MVKPSVYYDGACPVCVREIGLYRRCRGAEDINWVDVSAPGNTGLPDGLTREEALARFHLKRRDGQLLTGSEAFAQLWLYLPAFRPLGMLIRYWPLSWVADLAYRLFLKLRPSLQFMRSDRGRSCG